jgi:hypothetical protein
MTPLQIEMILHFHCCADPWPRHEAPACIEAVRMFQNEKLIEVPTDFDRVRLTEKGRAYVEFLCMLPLPMVTWGIPGPFQFSIPEGGV